MNRGCPNNDYKKQNRVKCMEIKLIPLRKNDKDMVMIKAMHNESSISKYISISEMYFNYVTNTENVVYYKIIVDGRLVGGIHSEVLNDIMDISICILPEYQKQGFASFAMKKLIASIPQSISKIQVSIDETNVASIRLFEHLGFKKDRQEEELIDYIYIL